MPNTPIQMAAKGDPDNCLWGVTLESFFPGEAKGGGPRVKPGTAKGDAYCARSAAQKRASPKAAADPNSPLNLSRKRWKCSGEKSKR
jgi:hypothetical protein